ncbi:ATP-dependent DNA ligase [Hyalangium minutum]|uniref:DNA ligase (ATP) n=1 Tax=Hyalangium minutum TaxID=394096 RepID=A0A085W7R3_9BACT|nr:ATP-dependent DNA ligase [Hyalangium minutum]KFE63726.1 ATP-dependent DNA ligase [Hyalangium minutum]
MKPPRTAGPASWAALDLPLTPPYPPMEAELVRDIPPGDDWQYEPKWDGFRCIVYRDGDHVELQSKAGQPLGRYFPELVEAVRELSPQRFVLDGEIVIPEEGGLSFDALLLRIHPAASRVAMLAKQSPSRLYVFDLLVDARRQLLTDKPLMVRREKLEAFASRYLEPAGQIRLSPATHSQKVARAWLGSQGMDGVVAKRLSSQYTSGERTGMVKVKPQRTADCVVGGFRWAERRESGVGSILLGLYGKDGLLHHVGYCSSFSAKDKKELVEPLESLRGAPGFTGKAPGGPSRWSKRDGAWEPLQTRLVVEVAYDHFSQGRFRHGTQFVRWRPDKAPEQCRMEQVLRRRSRAEVPYVEPGDVHAP